jgi:spermine oxidase
MTEYQTIVIGGGISGLSACVQLLNNGVENILLLEADSMLGGRIRTTPFRIYPLFYFAIKIKKKN